MLNLISLIFVFFFFKQKTAYEMRISDWSSDVCSSDLARGLEAVALAGADRRTAAGPALRPRPLHDDRAAGDRQRTGEHAGGHTGGHGSGRCAQPTLTATAGWRWPSSEIGRAHV